MTDSILIVEDNPGDARIVCEFLRLEASTSPMEVSCAASLREALDLLGSHTYTVALIDLSLPDCTGLDTVRRIRQAAPALAFVVLTGLGDECTGLAAIREGAQEYLDKNELDEKGLVRALRYAVERNRLELERTSLGEQLRQAQKLETIGRMAGGIAHDFNNILGAIIGYAELAKAKFGDTDPRLLHFVQMILDSGARGAGLVAGLLAVSRKSHLAIEIIDVRTVVEQVANISQETFRGVITVVRELADQVLPVSADTHQLSSALLNLAVNARDAMEGKGILTFRAALAATPPVDLKGTVGPCVRIEVIDTGSGMDEDVRTHLFEPFFTTKGPGKGTGLGLAGVHGCVTQHGGSIHVESAPGKGTAISIFLPLAAT